MCVGVNGQLTSLGSRGTFLNYVVPVGLEPETSIPINGLEQETSILLVEPEDY